MGKILFWACVFGILIYGYQNHWFDGIGNFFNMIKSDVEYQKNFVPTERPEIDTDGVLEVEQESKTVRRSGLGTAHRGY